MQVPEVLVGQCDVAKPVGGQWTSLEEMAPRWGPWRGLVAYLVLRLEVIQDGFATTWRLIRFWLADSMLIETAPDFTQMEARVLVKERQNPGTIRFARRVGGHNHGRPLIILRAAAIFIAVPH